MSYTIPTLQQLYDAHLARHEAQLGQDAPINDYAFLVVLSAAEAGLDIGLYKYAVDAVKQNLALTATGEGLDRIGEDNSTPRKNSQAAIVEAELPATTGTVIPVSREFISDSNGLRYRTTEEVISVASVATLNLKCVELGTTGNLENGETLSISSQIAGAETTATVTDTVQNGVERESDTDYRPRVIFAQIAITGGGNATDHKIWGEAVSGVRRIFAYAGRPASEGDSYPGDRLLYVEATTSIDSDGLAPVPLLNSVRDAINTDPATGISRMTLGMTDDTLFIESIIRTSIYVQISDLDVASESESACKADLETACDLYFRSIAPYVAGVDLIQTRNDTITNVSLSKIVNDVLESYGANAQVVAFGLVVGVFVPLYLLNPGELAKLGGITYA